jgi:hypothetical protein
VTDHGNVARLIPRSPLLDDQSDPAPIIDRLMNQALTRLALLSSVPARGVVQIAGLARPFTSGVPHVSKYDDDLHGLVAHYGRATTHRRRLMILKAVQDAAGVAQSDTMAPERRIGHAEWRRRIVLDPRSSRVAAPDYGVSHNLIARIRREAKDAAHGLEDFESSGTRMSAVEVCRSLHASSSSGPVGGLGGSTPPRCDAVPNQERSAAPLNFLACITEGPGPVKSAQELPAELRAALIEAGFTARPQRIHHRAVWSEDPPAKSDPTDVIRTLVFSIDAANAANVVSIARAVVGDGPTIRTRLLAA